MIHFRLTTWLWRCLHNYFLKIMHSLSIVDFWSKTIWTNQLVGLLRNSRIHIEFHSKLFIRIKNGLNNEMIKLSVKSYFDFNQMVVMNFWKVKIEPYFQKSFWNEFFYVYQNFYASTWLKYLSGLLFLWTLWGFLFGFPKWVHHTK
jgi:GTPase SAR1 family protein